MKLPKTELLTQTLATKRALKRRPLHPPPRMRDLPPLKQPRMPLLVQLYVPAEHTQLGALMLRRVHEDVVTRCQAPHGERVVFGDVALAAAGMGVAFGAGTVGWVG